MAVKYLAGNRLSGTDAERLALTRARFSYHVRVIIGLIII